MLSPRAGYRTMKMAGSAINRTIEQTKAAISTLLPSVWPRIEAFEDGVSCPMTRGQVAQSSTAALAGLLGVLHAEGALAGLSWADAR